MWQLYKGLSIIAIPILLACEKGDIPTAVDPLIELYAVHVTSRPVVDGRDNDSVWQDAPSYTIHVYELSEDGTTLNMESGFNVKLKAVWWEEWMLSGEQWIERPFVSILITWPDDSKNINKNAWIYNPIDSSWTFSDNGSDELLFIWFSTSNYTDLWYWDAALTNPLGYAEDDYLETINVDTTTFIDLVNIDGMNYGNDYGDYRNTWDLNYNDNLTPRDSTDDYPKMAWKFDVDSTAPSLPRIYSSEDENKYFLLSYDADFIENTPYFNIDRAVTIPGYILEDPKGPSTDIVAAGRYANGYWTVELVRPAATNDGNDIGFVPSSRYSSYAFNIYIGNNIESFFELGSNVFAGSEFTSFTFEFVQ